MITRLLVGLARIVSGTRTTWVRPLEGERQRVFFANHTSHLDFILLWAALPPRVRATARPVAGRDYWERGRLRRYLAAKVFNAVLIDRPSAARGAGETSGDREQTVAAARDGIERMVQAMGERWSLIVFPEGTRGSGAEVSPFKSGLYHLCRRLPSVELVPVYLENLNRILPKGESVPVPMMCRVVFGEPMRLESGEGKEAFLARAREAVVRLGAVGAS